MSYVVNVDMGIFVPLVAFFHSKAEAEAYAEAARKKGAVRVEVSGGE